VPERPSRADILPGMPVGDGEHAGEPLLLHSLYEFRDLIFSCLEIAGARTVVEIGSESGVMTHELAKWASRRDGHLYSVEPSPVSEIVELDRRSEQFTLVHGRSPDALSGVLPCDAYLVDGDHNYWVVSHELDAIFAPVPADGRPPLAILHDVGWPCARRDQYYAPDALPPEGLHPHSWDRGKVLDRAELVEGGFRGPLDFASAEREGGPRNGVLTAVKDFLARREDLTYRHVPAIFGLGVIFPSAAPYANQLDDALAPFHQNPLLAKLERNRIRLFLSLIQAEGGPRTLDAARNRLVAEYDARLSELEAENARLRQEAVRLQMKSRVPA
jgi:Methyltransferase domain